MDTVEIIDLESIQTETSVSHSRLSGKHCKVEPMEIIDVESIPTETRASKTRRSRKQCKMEPMEIIDVENIQTEDDFCPQCNKTTFDQKTRPIQEACGHRKCRVCLLIDEDDCTQCLVKIVESSEVDNEDEIATTVNTERIEEELCPQCNEVTSSRGRGLIQDACGHKKCRLCLLTDEQECEQCLETMVECEDEKPLKCDVCQKPFGDGTRLRHLLTQGNMRPYRCNQCTKQFLDRSNLEPICTVDLTEETEMEYGNKENLNPQFTVDLSEGGMFICEECDEWFENKDELERHSVVHRGNKLYKCKECKASFRVASYYKKHIFQHVVMAFR